MSPNVINDEWIDDRANVWKMPRLFAASFVFYIAHNSLIELICQQSLAMLQKKRSNNNKYYLYQNEMKWNEAKWKMAKNTSARTTTDAPANLIWANESACSLYIFVYFCPLLTKLYQRNSRSSAESIQCATRKNQHFIYSLHKFRVEMGMRVATWEMNKLLKMRYANDIIYPPTAIYCAYWDMLIRYYIYLSWLSPSSSINRYEWFWSFVRWFVHLFSSLQLVVLRRFQYLTEFFFFFIFHAFIHFGGVVVDFCLLLLLVVLCVCVFLISCLAATWNFHQFDFYPSTSIEKELTLSDEMRLIITET